MKLDSKYFDSIRVTKGRARTAKVERVSEAPQCQWRGCVKRGPHKAPKGRSSEGEYYNFCRDHVTEYNKSYNYFAGMNDGEVADYQKSATTGHRPTWSMGVNGSAPGASGFPGGAPGEEAPEDPLEVLKAMRGRRRYAERPKSSPRRKMVQKGASKHLLSLNLDDNATPEEIRTQFKALAKLHHPDHNGGDRGSEERFREILAAYNYLKQAGLC